MKQENLPNSALFDLLTDSDLIAVLNGSFYEVSPHFSGDTYLEYLGYKIGLAEVISLDELQDVSVENQFLDLKDSLINKLKNPKRELPSERIAELSQNNLDLNLFLAKLFFIFNKRAFNGNERSATILGIDEIKTKYKKSGNFTKWLTLNFSNRFVAYKNNFWNLNNEKEDTFFSLVANHERYFLSPKKSYKIIKSGFESSQAALFNDLMKYVNHKATELQNNLDADEQVRLFIQDVETGKAVIKPDKIYYKKLSKNSHIIYRHISPYILYERKNGKYYRFPECDAGIPLMTTSKGIEINGSYPVFVGDYIHPASPKGKSGLIPICCGDDDSIVRTLDGNESTLVKTLAVLDGIEFSVKSAYVSQSSAWSPIYAYEKLFSPFEVKPGDSSFDKDLVTNGVK